VVGARLTERLTRAIVSESAGSRIVVVSDARVARIVAPPLLAALRRAGARPLLLAFPAGERSKSRETKAQLEDRLAAAAVGRDVLVVALGGGVTGDLAGFLAATWHRGVPVFQVPTSLLAMADAALGGKTAVDHPAGKNLVGAFHPPRALWADVATLATLPDRELRCGLAEAVKIAAALDARLFSRLERDAARLVARDEHALLAVIARCLRLKGRIVAIDPADRGPRAILNFGHTAAHAVEAASAYRVRHGEAVAIGLVAEARIAERVSGFPREATERLRALLSRFGLPVALPSSLDARTVARYALADKKTRGGTVRCALPESLGRPPQGTDPTFPIRLGRDLVPAWRGN
jgi:3-dehydroquinate synthase